MSSLIEEVFNKINTHKGIDVIYVLKFRELYYVIMMVFQ